MSEVPASSERTHSCAEVIELRDPPTPSFGLEIALLGLVGTCLGAWAWGGFEAVGVFAVSGLAAAASLAVIVAVFLHAVNDRLSPQGGLVGVVRSLVRLLRGRTAVLAASLCPHGVLLRKPGSEPSLLPWSRVREIGVLRHWRGPVVVATLAHGADPVGMPAVRRLLRGTPDDPELRWLGRVPRFRLAAVRASLAAWHPSVSAVGALRFYRGELNQPAGDVGGHERMGDLAGWLTSDIQNYAPDCLDVLARVEDVRSGRSTLEEWSGNSTQARFEPSGVTVTPLLPRARRTHYSLAEVHEAALKYLGFLAPTAQQKAQAVEAWMQASGRPHPCRHHLPPASAGGPSESR